MFAGDLWVTVRVMETATSGVLEHATSLTAIDDDDEPNHATLPTTVADDNQPHHATLSIAVDDDAGRSSPPLRKPEYQRAEFLTYLVLPSLFMSTPHRP